MRTLAVVLLTLLHAAPAPCQDRALTRAAPSAVLPGDRFVGVAAGYSWFSPRGKHWGYTIGRRIYLASVRTERVHGAPGLFAIASSLEFPFAVVHRSKDETMDCWEDPDATYCIPDFSAKIAAGLGVLPGFKVIVGRTGRTRMFGGVAAGLMFFNTEVPVRGAGRATFALEYGAGVEVSRSQGRALTVGYKFFHISNGDMWERNPGLDGNVFYVGLLKRR